MKKTVIALLTFMACLVFALPEDSDQPIEVEFDEAEATTEDGISILRGDVTLEQGTLWVTGDVMRVKTVDNRIVQVTSEGEPAHFRQQANVGEPPVVGTADVIIYFTEDERIEFHGDAVLEQPARRIEGELIHWDTRAGRVNVSADEDEKVRLFWKPAKTETDQEN